MMTWKRLRAMAKYRTTKLNSIDEPVTDTVLEVQSQEHDMNIEVKFGLQEAQEVKDGDLR